MNRVLALILFFQLVMICSCETGNEQMLFPEVNKKNDSFPIFKPSSKLDPQTVQGIIFYGYELVSQNDTITGYWGRNEGFLYFINVFDVDCERMIPMTSFSENIEKKHYSFMEDCQVPYFYELIVKSEIVKSDQDEIITKVEHFVNDPTMKIIHTIPDDIINDTSFIKNRPIAYFKISSKKGVVEYHKNISDSSVYLPY